MAQGKGASGGRVRDCRLHQTGGARAHFGALLLGAYSGDALHYVGKVGTGFDQKALATLYRRFQPLVRVRSALADPPRDTGVVYLAPGSSPRCRFRSGRRTGSCASRSSSACATTSVREKCSCQRCPHDEGQATSIGVGAIAHHHSRIRTRFSGPWRATPSWI